MRKKFCDFCGEEDDFNNDWFSRNASIEEKEMLSEECKGDQLRSFEDVAEITFLLFHDKEDICYECVKHLSVEIDKFREVLSKKSSLWDVTYK